VYPHAVKQLSLYVQELEDLSNAAVRRFHACRRQLDEAGQKSIEAALVELPPALVPATHSLGCPLPPACWLVKRLCYCSSSRCPVCTPSARCMSTHLRCTQHAGHGDGRDAKRIRLQCGTRRWACFVDQPLPVRLAALLIH
jgi:hypothetical protein